tara:strand:+ start:501 stop:1022 length:522 start_codon:yes stop_codon:yes gene_type:complete
MKKLLLLITVLFFGISTANAQIEKASEGTIYEVMFTPNLDAAGQFALQDSHIVVRDFNGDGTATRYKLRVDFESMDGGEDTMTLGAMYGKEKHHEGTARLGTYTGWEGGLLFDDPGSSDSTLDISAGVFVGANYYIANNLYIGTEISFNAEIGDDSFGVEPGVKGMLTLGWKM